MAYTCYHLTRKPISVVKAVLHRNCSLIPKQIGGITDIPNEETWCDYAPFGKSIEMMQSSSSSSVLFHSVNSSRQTVAELKKKSKIKFKKMIRQPIKVNNRNASDIQLVLCVKQTK